ncbi:tripartite tricarboxylate transporter substrate binding protein [Allopusillimonas soli]|uniref:Tripartite tricarboxylate transporter substrate binding protein n=1 Tax=Allopusillimonas soli TaxID=659016 RepID=A0A853FFH9_9BURK|nr:tripartite tricarboxylate transporter substrate binding protein [Allopusillimonas soli]NYT36776.1 tripartite tricarboxylate transporter substrate binding protein [Allopusillimonas soli]TEA75247.1 tripartite tricarboxylate transporter substrate binding protein [Allopusillimonas soli]
MNQTRRQLLQAAVVGVPMLGLAGFAHAQTSAYPGKPLRLYVPFGPGSGSDVYARYFGERLAGRLGQPVVVENKPGAGGAIAVKATTEPPRDGYTILLGSNSPMAVNVSAYKSLSYDPVKDLQPICGLTRSMAILIVPAESPLQTLDDLVDRGRQSPPLNMGTYSAGYQLAAAPFLRQAGFKWQDINYKGLSQTTTDVIGGQIDIAVVDTPTTVQIVKSGKVRALAVTGVDRHPDLPDVPTLQEKGYDGAVHYSWTSLWVKAGTPESVVNILSDNLLQILNAPESREYVESHAGEIMALGPREMRAFQKSEIARFAEAVETLGFKPI